LAARVPVLKGGSHTLTPRTCVSVGASVQHRCARKASACDVESLLILCLAQLLEFGRRDSGLQGFRRRAEVAPGSPGRGKIGLCPWPDSGAA
jgi:hypothetical protein